MIEITISRRSKVNKGNYESEEVMAAVKSQLLDDKNFYEELEAIDSKVKLFIERKTKEIKGSGK